MSDGGTKRSAIQQLVGDADRFFEDSWQKQWIHIGGQVDSVLLSSEDINALFATSLLRIPHFRLVMAGRAVPPSSYVTATGPMAAPETVVETAQVVQMFTEGIVDTAKVAEIVAAGATLILQGVHRFHPPLAELCSRMTTELGHVCQANAYVTPRGEQGLAPHSDPHDAFVIQAFGTKRWQLGTDDVAARTLHPGDVLYLPKGTLHSARAGEALSGHVTIGVRTTSWRDVLLTGVHALIDDSIADVELAALPSTWLTHRALAASELDQLLEQARAALAEADAESILDRYAEAFRQKIRPASVPFTASPAIHNAATAQTD
jgi:bifunctional lysine-specific demethylase and histidyl-hydroxylase NO66